MDKKIGCVNNDCDKCKAQPEQEPVGYGWKDPFGDWYYSSEKELDYITPLYTTPPQREPLTDDTRRLTEYWLKKFGFNKHKREDYIGLYKLEKNDLSFTLFAVDDDGHGNEGVTKLRISNSYGDELCIEDKLIEYVHQLKNLYFALTGEELKIEAAHGIKESKQCE